MRLPRIGLGLEGGQTNLGYNTCTTKLNLACLTGSLNSCTLETYWYSLNRFSIILYRTT